ncbi:Alpha/Beta hydrolase protein [Bisporella sp. PMI_857]|nr:Alpha/Beta hydrolase protein [Bisporella sp. PMI_857]
MGSCLLLLYFALLAVFDHLTGAFAKLVFVTEAIGGQKPLLSKSAFTLREQSDEVCDAGSRQWTGWVDVSEEKRLFFWFFESRANSQEDPVILWLNGGPGGSSLLGLFEEIGPCQVNKDQNITERHKHSWTNFANVLFIDQPAGVGFSSIRNGTTGGPDNLQEAAQDFNKFLAVFFTDVFPQFSHLPFHIAGESFGGTYVPGFVDYISKRQQLGVPDVFQTPIQSIVLVDAVIDTIQSGSLGTYDHMCNFDSKGKNRLRLGFNETACRAVEKAVPECERLDHLCKSTYDKEVCAAAYFFCAGHIDSYLFSGPIARNVYDDRYVCNGDYPTCGLYGISAPYLNDPKVQRALGADGWNYTMINFDLGTRWDESKESFMPTIRELTWILDESPTKVLVLQGNNDIVVNTEGQKRVYDDQPWNHQAKYRLEKFADWYWRGESGVRLKGGDFKVVDKLAFVSFDNAGHTSPGDQDEAAAFILRCWINNGRSSGCPFEIN